MLGVHPGADFLRFPEFASDSNSSAPILLRQNAPVHGNSREKDHAQPCIGHLWFSIVAKLKKKLQMVKFKNDGAMVAVVQLTKSMQDGSLKKFVQPTNHIRPHEGRVP